MVQEPVILSEAKDLFPGVDVNERFFAPLRMTGFGCLCNLRAVSFLFCFVLTLGKTWQMFKLRVDIFGSVLYNANTCVKEYIYA